jgi:hypothetical protein
MIRNRLARAAALLLWFAAICSVFLHAQRDANPPQTTDTRATLNGTPAAVTRNEAPARSSFFSGRIQLLTADAITHFRYMDAGPGNVTARDEYYKISTRVQINFVGDGTTYLQARGESGRNFVSSYEYTGIGLHQRYWSFNLKSLYLGQKIGRHMEAQAGGVEYDPGVGTEATYADNDGWLEGYRLRFIGLGYGLPDKVSMTVGYVGDYAQPNVLARLHRMGDENYIQLLAVQKLGKSRDLSVEFDSLQTIRLAREAFRWQKVPLPVVAPDLTIEAISRASDNPTFGWAASLARNLDQKGRFRSGIFYSDIPTGMFQRGGSQVFRNGDCYALGKRVGPTFRVAPFKDFDITLFGSDRLDQTPGTRYRGQIAVHYQLASLLNRTVR